MVCFAPCGWHNTWGHATRRHKTMCQKDEQRKVCSVVCVMHMFGVLGVARMLVNQIGM